MNRELEKTEVSTHYEFGKNWERFSQLLTPERVRSAEREFERFVGRSRLAGAHLLDIGSGSGLHSLAAINLGATLVDAVDFDPDSVKTSKAVLEKFAPGRSWTVKEANVLSDFAGVSTQYDIVYSWGVLHHTGDMWGAIEQAARLVKSGGWLAVALYIKTPFCPLWVVEKRMYRRLPSFLQSLLAFFFVGLQMLRRVVVLENPVTWYRRYQEQRGMSAYHDAHDWLGGYPYESVSVEQLVNRMKTLGFGLSYSHNTGRRLGVLGTGCGEFLFRREAIPVT